MPRNKQGANKGIGYEVARQLACNGLTVLLESRDSQRREAAAKTLQAENAGVYCIPLNVADEQSIKSAAELVAERWEKVDVLVNNAGVNYEFASRIRSSLLDVSILKDTFETDVFGAFAVIHHFLPLLRQTEAAQIINVSSTLGSLTSVTRRTNTMMSIQLLTIPRKLRSML